MRNRFISDVKKTRAGHTIELPEEYVGRVFFEETPQVEIVVLEKNVLLVKPFSDIRREA